MSETKMRVKEVKAYVRVYPIKSIRGASLSSHRASAFGFEHDRIFMLRRASDKKNMHVPHFPSMCLFTTELSPADNPEKLLVRYGKDHTFNKPDQKLPPEESVLEIPLQPDVKELSKAETVDMHSSSTDAYLMPEKYSKWFSDRFGFDVELDYIGLYKREVLGNINPNVPAAYVGDPDPRKAAEQGGIGSGLSGGWLDGLKSSVGNVLGTVASYTGMDPYKPVNEGIGFADCSPFLVINYDSFLNAQKRVETDIDIEKFRPNVVVEGAENAWVEDYWGEIAIGEEVSATRIAFTSNCGRCASINVDYETGRPAEGGQGRLLKALQSDRRVDPGNKWSPVFGRSGFLSVKNGIKPSDPVFISVGDEVVVTKTNERRTHWYWPNIGT